MIWYNKFINSNLQKKNIGRIGDVSLNLKKKIILSKGKARNHYKSKGGYAPIDYKINKPLDYDFDITKKLESNNISQENIGDFLKKNIIAGI